MWTSTLNTLDLFELSLITTKKISMNTKFLLATLLSCIVGLLSAQTIYVEPFGNGNGSSWSDASSLQSALSAASSGTEIWVKEGLYTPVTCNSCSQTERDISFEIPSGVQLYGGFDGTEMSLDERDFNANLTILSGDIDGNGTSYNNSYSVVSFENVSNQTILDGFNIRDGQADTDGLTIPRKRGGGIYNNGSNTGGNSNPVIRHCIFENNYATSQGGAMYNYAIDGGSTAPLIEDCIFRNNESNLGGAVFNDARDGNGSPIFTRCKFIENEATATGGAVYTFGRFNGGFGNPKFTNCLFKGNMASSSGAVYSLGTVSGNVITEITNCTFVENYANTGGAVYVNATDGGDCTTNVMNCIFWENTASFDNIFHYSGNSDPQINLRNSLVDIDNCEDLLLGSGSISCQGGIIFNQDPLFSDVEGLEYHLTEFSPCVNVGSNSDINETGEVIDLDGLQRIQDNTVDMGCFEFGEEVNIPLTITQQALSQIGCEAMSVTFVVSAIGAQPVTYQWQKDNVDIAGATLSSLTINDLSTANEGNYSCVLTDVNNDSLNSEDASLTVMPVVIPAVSLTASELEVCMGENIVFTATPTSGGASGNPFYIWQVNGNNVDDENDANFTLEDVNGDEVVQVTMISAEDCAEPSTAFSELLMVTTLPSDSLASISISTESEQICLGETVVFNSNVSNAGDNPTYVWRLNEMIVAMTETYTTDELAAGNSVTCEVTKIGGCGEMLTTISDTLSVDITVLPASQVAIESSVTQICQGDSVVFSSNVTNPGISQTYLWRLNGEMVSMTETYTTDQLIPENAIICEVTVTDECGVETTAVSNAQTIDVEVPSTPEITIEASNTIACAGVEINFSALVENGGDNPIYDWRVNDVSVAVDSVFTSNSLNDNDIVTCMLTSSETCVTSSEAVSNIIVVTIFPTANPEVLLEGNGTEVCSGGSVTFNASPIDGGLSPTISWLVNGMVFPNEGLELTIDNITETIFVQIQMETSAPCATDLIVFSDTINVDILPLITPVVEIDVEKTEYCNEDDISALFIASADFLPVSYIWSVNGEEVQNSVANSLSLTNFGTGDFITCQTISEGACLTNEEANSNEIVLTVFELPTVSLAALDTICSDGDLFLLEGGTPLGGEYLGDFIEADLFDPVIADVGFHSVVYTYTDENNCSNFAEEQIEVVLCTDIDDLQSIELEVFPNPFSNKIQIFAEDIINVEMRNVEGKLMSVSTQIFGNNAHVSAENLVSGVYYLRVLTEKGVGVSILVNE